LTGVRYFGKIRNMNADVFAALANELRLSVFRLLVAVAPGGLPAGQIADRLEVPASTLSTHLAQLERAGLLRSWREQQRILYAIDTEGTRTLVGFLIDDCCGGQPELCGYQARPRSSRTRRGARHD
jgi:ArsR family transcriptional regulator, arsenate/arsenite/antimonite-responsive transcriptional repressor